MLLSMSVLLSVKANEGSENDSDCKTYNDALRGFYVHCGKTLLLYPTYVSCLNFYLTSTQSYLPHVFRHIADHLFLGLFSGFARASQSAIKPSTLTPYL